jgi:hypothetical protein
MVGSHIYLTARLVDPVDHLLRAVVVEVQLTHGMALDGAIGVSFVNRLIPSIPSADSLEFWESYSLSMAVLRINVSFK